MMFIEMGKPICTLLVVLFLEQVTSEPCITSLRVVDLTHTISEKTLYWPGKPGFNFTIISRGQQQNYWYEENYFSMPEHAGTHINAPAHFSEGGYRTQQIPIENLVGPGVIINVKLAQNFIPRDFLRGDIMVDGARHLIFATTQQLELLCKAKTWYVDATFKVLRSRDTFDQLFGIHAFLRKEDDVKQVPLVFVFMSRRRSKDYKNILKKLKEILPNLPCVQKFVLDFEAAVWKAIRSEFPEAKVTGCAFHWTQAVWKKAQSLGLSTLYRKDASGHKVIRRVLALPLLPAEHIRPAFIDQQTKAEASQ